MLRDLARTYLYQMRVQSELLGQCRDQQFVNLVCHRPDTVEELRSLRKNAYFRTDTIAPFIGACRVLLNALNDGELPLETRKICATLLAQRLARVQADPQRRLRHLLIFGELEEKLDAWMLANMSDVDQ